MVERARGRKSTWQKEHVVERARDRKSTWQGREYIRRVGPQYNTWLFVTWWFSRKGHQRRDTPFYLFCPSFHSLRPGRQLSCVLRRLCRRHLWVKERQSGYTHKICIVIKPRFFFKNRCDGATECTCTWWPNRRRTKHVCCDHVCSISHVCSTGHVCSIRHVCSTGSRSK